MNKEINEKTTAAGKRAQPAKNAAPKKKQQEKRQQEKRQQKGGKILMWILGTAVVLIAAVIIFFQIPWSKTSSSFQKDMAYFAGKYSLITNTSGKTDVPADTDVFTEEDFAVLPELLQNHLRLCGYHGKPKMSGMYAKMLSVPFRASPDTPPMIIDYSLYVSAHEPVRLALIESSLYGIPFEAYDSFQEGVGFMKGVVGKLFPLFNQTGPDMDKGQLITYLVEAGIIPSSFSHGFITFEPVSDTQIKATITYGTISGSGIYTFSPDGLIESFHTEERANMGMDGQVKYMKWSTVYGNYTEVNGILQPGSIKVTWHDEGGDLVYFYADSLEIEFL